MGHSGKCRVPQGATTDLHVISLSNCELRTDRLNLSKDVNAVLSVGERNWSSFWEEFEGIEQLKTLTLRDFIVANGLVSGNDDSAGYTNDSKVLKTSNSTLPSVRTSQKTRCALIKTT